MDSATNAIWTGSAPFFNTAMIIGFLSAVVGLIVLVMTQSGPWGLAAGLVTFLLIRWLRPSGPEIPPEMLSDVLLESDLLESPLKSERTTPIKVICKTATPTRQEWVSLKTGRLYDVLSADGVAGARPGDEGRVTLVGTHWRIDPPLDHELSDALDNGSDRDATSPDTHKASEP